MSLLVITLTLSHTFLPHPLLSLFPQTGMWVCRHAVTFLPETPFSRETEIMSGVTDKVRTKHCIYLLSELEST